METIYGKKYFDPNGISIEPGQTATISTERGLKKTGKIVTTSGGFVTVRCDSTDGNLDGPLFSATPEKTIVL